MKAGLWVALAAAAAMAAGVTVGFTVCHAHADTRDEAELSAADRVYLQDLTRDLDLRADQVALLGAILRRRAQDQTTIYRNSIKDVPKEVREALNGARRAADKRIQFMLDPPQRARYEQMLEAQDSKR